MRNRQEMSFPNYVFWWKRSLQKTQPVDAVPIHTQKRRVPSVAGALRTAAFSLFHRQTCLVGGFTSGSLGLTVSSEFIYKERPEMRLDQQFPRSSSHTRWARGDSAAAAAVLGHGPPFLLSTVQKLRAHTRSAGEPAFLRPANAKRGGQTGLHRVTPSRSRVRK